MMRVRVLAVVVLVLSLGCASSGAPLPPDPAMRASPAASPSGGEGSSYVAPSANGVGSGDGRGGDRHSGGGPDRSQVRSGDAVAADRGGGAGDGEGGAGEEPLEPPEVPGVRAGDPWSGRPTDCLAPHKMRPAAPPPANQPACPNPKTCPLYALFPAGTGSGGYNRGWRPGPDGYSRIPFEVNPTPPSNSSLAAEEIEAAIFSAARTWTAASPRLCFVFLGRTTSEPRIGDGRTVFALGNVVDWRWDDDRFIVEAIIRRIRVAAQDTTRYDPCEQRDGSCRPTDSRYHDDIEDWLAHEMGHVLGLDHVYDDGHLLTMHPDANTAQRYRVTLGLGDVLGIRHLYPCDCPLPPIYDP